MGDEEQFQRREVETRSFEDCRTIDLADEQAVGFWSERLGVSRDEIVAAVKAVGPNTLAVALKLEAPHQAATAPTPPPV